MRGILFSTKNVEDAILLSQMIWEFSDERELELIAYFRYFFFLIF
jgi:hypothetical protein